MIHIPEWLSTWFIPIAVVAYFFVALYIYAPLKVRRQQTKSIEFECSAIELTNMPREVSHAFFQNSAFLASVGFQAVGHVRHWVANTRQDGFISIWVNHSSLDSAQIIGICTPSQLPALKVVTLLTFRTEFSDGTSIVTTNSRGLSIFPADPRVSSICCRNARDIAVMYRFHRARVDRDRSGRLSTLEKTKDAASRLQFEHQETYTRLINAGYYVKNESKQLYVPTFRGAYLMTYRLLPPWKQIQKMIKDRRATQTLRELGFGGNAAFRNARVSDNLPV